MQPLLARPQLRSVPSIMFDDTESLSSADGSSKSVVTSAKRQPRPRTMYNICYPPPKNGARQRKQRPLLQLHRVNQSSRPKPTFDIVPSSRLSSSTFNEFRKAFGDKKPSFPSDGLAILKADEYLESQENDLESDPSWSGSVLGIAYEDRKADKSSRVRGRMFLHDGTEWTAISLSNGGYEFVSTDKSVETKVRWFTKRPQGNRTDSGAGSLKASEPESLRPSSSSGANQTAKSPNSSKAFSCSVISPSSRRHPVVAKLTSGAIDIPDTYNVPSARPTSSSASISESQAETKMESQKVTVALRTLITATAIYVALQEGWVPDFKMERPSGKTSPKSTITPIMRAFTMPVEHSKEAMPKSPNPFTRLFRKTPKESKGSEE